MGKIHKPRSGSLAFYPRKRAARIVPSFSTFPDAGAEGVQPVNFLCYKAGMLHLIARDAAQKTTSKGQNIYVPATVLECPALKVFGVRAYGKSSYGLNVLVDVFAGKVDKHLLRRIKNFRKKTSKKKKEEKEKKVEEKKSDFTEIEKIKDKIAAVRLLVHTQPALCGFGKKKPDVSEVALSGNLEEQIKFAKEKLGVEVKVEDVFKEQQMVDAKAIDKGKGFSGSVERFGVKIQRRKAKTRRIVGSIGPWHPATVMWTVARPGQHGYQTRTEFNKRIIMVGNEPEKINPDSGFKNYGVLKNSFLVVAGSVPGVAKRAVALRFCVRKPREERFRLGEIVYISTESKKKKGKKEVKKEVKKEKPKEVKKKEKGREKSKKKG